MEQLEYFFEKKFKKLPFIQRKKKILPNKNILLNGVRFCGKTFLIKDFLLQNSHKKTLYINLDDIRVDIDLLNKELQNFINEKKIEIVAIDSYKKDCQIPKAKQIILSTATPLNIAGFEQIDLYTLDFEEYLAFDRSTDIKTVFNNFLKNGSFPEISQLLDLKKEDRFLEILSLLFKDEVELSIFKEIAKTQGYKSSAYHIFTKLKSKIKISKDRFYQIFNSLEEKKIVFLLEKFLFPRAPKKIYLCDFVLKNYTSFSKDFLKMFENMIFLEMKKRNYEIYYYDQIDFYLPKSSEAVFCVPFGNEVSIQKRVDSAFKYIKEIKVSKIVVVTVANSFKYYIDDIAVFVLPFYEWVLAELE